MKEMEEEFEEFGDKRQRRNRKHITNEIMRAVSTVISEQGFAHLGINSVAIEAKVEKPFIYRNFGTFDKVLEEYILKNDYWMKFIMQRVIEGKIDEEGNIDVKSLFVDLMTELYKTMDENRDFSNIILWELYENSVFIRKTAQRRENETKDEINLLAQTFSDTNLDICAITALMISGIYYLVLHKNTSTFCSIDFKTKEGKKRLNDTLVSLSELIFEKSDYQRSMVNKMIKKGLDPELIAELTDTPIENVRLLIKNIK